MKTPSIDINALPDLDTVVETVSVTNGEDLLIVVATYFWENGAISSMIF